MDEDFEFRAVLVKIQSSLSDDDRIQLHFLFGEDIPRRLQNGSLETALDVLQTLFDRSKISKNNSHYLVNALRVIERHDCAQRLLDYNRLVTTAILPPLPVTQQQNQAEASSAVLSLAQERLTTQELITDLEEMEEMDGIVQPPAESVSTRFDSPEPDPMDFKGIDLRPFEDAAYPWTEEYSRLLVLPYHPREYQIEIIRDAIRNRNTIVCLRTGSGKTFIASVLIKYYFIKTLKDNLNTQFKSLFFVPRKAIRLQQAKAILGIKNVKVQICEDDQTIDQLIDKNHVVVATPQKFVNCLKKGTVRLSQINLMIFDECHNTSGANPYCEIMKFYLCPSKQETTEMKPLIIGLTATISAKDAGEKSESVEKNLISLCSKLACQTISTTCDMNNISEINREISRPQNDQFEFVCKVEYNKYLSDYLKIFENVIEQIKRHLDDHEVLNGQIFGSSGFIGQLILQKRTCETKGQLNNIIICDYLLLLTKKYSALKDLPFDMVISHILETIEQYHKRYEQPIPMDNLLYEHCKTELKKILDQHAEHPATNTKLDNLVQLLKRHAREDTKGLVLVGKTFYTKTLNDYLSNHPELQNIIKSTCIVGQRSADYSQTIHEQEEGLAQFRTEKYNVLIATDIVQEGLDIPTCSYVIRYEFVSDEIGTIQSRGRARARNSSYYLITEIDSINHKREQNNKAREDEMEQAISEWPTFDKTIFLRAVQDKTKSLIIQWEKDLKRQKEEKDALQEIGKKDGTICCRKCNRELGQLAWLKRRNTIFFINNPKFFITNQCTLDSTYKSFQENLRIGEVKCHCGNSLGGCQKFTDRRELGALCALKCKQIKFMIENKKPYVEFITWNKNDRFDIEELEEI